MSQCNRSKVLVVSFTYQTPPPSGHNGEAEQSTLPGREIDSLDRDRLPVRLVLIIIAGAGIDDVAIGHDGYIERGGEAHCQDLPRTF